MLEFMMTMGLFRFPLMLLALVVVVLIVVQALKARRAGRAEPNPILFWGAVAAVLGFLGQYLGMYHSLRVISQATKLSPQLMAQGLAESFTTTLFGLVVFVVAALAWFGLGAWNRRQPGTGTGG
jgi:drug/metabolite transporter (DMT)-like permease